MQNAKRAESVSQYALSQFEITSKLLRNLYKLNLTPVTKLVLLELTTHLNESKNGSVVFPSVGYIAEVLGIGLTAAKKAINDLIKQGLIIKSKREKISGNHNKYLLTPKVQNMTSEQADNKLFKQPENDLLLIRTNKKEKINNKDEDYLKLYAQKRGVKNIQAYINAIKKNGGATQIIEEYKKIENKKKVLEKQIDLMRKKRIQEKEQAVPPTESWLALRNTIFKEYQ